MRFVIPALSVILVLLGTEAYLRYSEGLRYHEGQWPFIRAQINTLGFRDVEPSLDQAGEWVIVVGDSFSAGDGVRLEQTSTYHLRSLLKEDSAKFQVINAAKNGADTIAERIFLERLPTKPDVLVLQYFGNDIEGAAVRRGRMTAQQAVEETARPQLSEGLLFVLNRSAFWRTLIDPLRFRDPGGAYKRYFLETYNDDHVWKDHIKDLGRITQYCRIPNCKLLVVVFPYLEDDASALLLNRAYVPKVIAYFKQTGADVLDVRPIAGRLDFEERVASRANTHPSPRLHKMVGAAIRDKVLQ